jgi:signal transduction histidine kinase
VTTRISLPRIFLVGIGLLGLARVGLAASQLAQHWSQVTLFTAVSSPWSPVTIALFVTVGVAASAFVIIVPGHEGQTSSHDLGTMGSLACVVVFPPYIAILIAVVASTIAQVAFQPTGHRRAWQFTVFNVGSYVLATAASATLFAFYDGMHLLVAPKLPQQAAQTLLAVGGAVAVNYIVSYGLTVVSLWLIRRTVASRDGKTVSSSRVSAVTAIRDIFITSHRDAILPESTAAIVGILFGYLWLVNPPLAPIALLPLAVIYIAFQNFIRLQELDRLKSNFITEVSHELRTPLSSMVASSELLYHHIGDLQGDSIRDLSRTSYESSNHLFRVVENLLNASTLQSGTLTIRPVALSVDEIISDAVTQAQPFLESKNQSLELDLPFDLPEVLADPRHIVQVLINLLTNAAKYSATGTQVRIACQTEGDMVRIGVVDQGMGISDEDQAHIFERFYRVPSNTMTSVVGSGLGLSIVKSLVDMHHGQVGVVSHVGDGSTFWFTLPSA